MTKREGEQLAEIVKTVSALISMMNLAHLEEGLATTIADHKNYQSVMILHDSVHAGSTLTSYQQQGAKLEALIKFRKAINMQQAGIEQYHVESQNHEKLKRFGG